MESKIKAWVEYEYEYVKKYGDNCEVRRSIDRCYGAVMFCINNCFPSFNEELGNWWNNEMLPKFQILEEED